MKAFFLGITVSFFFFIPFIIYDNGYFIYYGDFNVQEIPFYQLAHEAVKSGNIFWNFNTDLGCNFIGSYSFYMLGSPFFLLTLPFPNHVVPYLMGPLLILKFGCATSTAYLYLKRYVMDPELAILGSVLYAFSGFSIYNIFFNHFHEAIVVFPLLLYACDEFMYKKRRGIFALCVFFSATMNYYFFVNQVVFLIIYWFVRFFSGSWHITPKHFLYFVFEFFLGVTMSSFILLPALFSVVQNPRATNFLSGFSALLYSHEQRYLHIITSFFFPPDIPARPNLTPNSEAKWSSIAAWLPFFGMSGVISFLKFKHETWLRRLLIILFFMTMVPVLNSSFQLFNAAFYMRWLYTLTLMMSLATIKSIQDKKINLLNGTAWSLGIVITFSLALGFIPDQNKIGLIKYPDRFWAYVAVSSVGLILLLVILKHSDKHKTGTVKSLTALTSTFSILISIYMITLGKLCAPDSKDFIIPRCLNHQQEIFLPDLDSSRVDVYNGMDNQAMFFKMKTIQAFHSIVPGSIMEFYPTIGVKRDVASRPDTKVYGLRSFTSCKYLLSYQGNQKSFSPSIMPGWKYNSTQNGFDIWENKCYVPFGFTYKNYISEDDYFSVNQKDRHLTLLKAIVLDDETVARNSDILEHANPSSFSFTEQEYFKDCDERNELTCSNFRTNRYGFSCEADVKFDKDQLIFFSVPYEKGFHATVNSSDVKIEKVNIGFMAVRVPGGQKSVIEFKFITPGLIPGLILTSTSITIYLLYVFLIKKFDPKNKFRNRKVYKIKG